MRAGFQKFVLIMHSHINQKKGKMTGFWLLHSIQSKNEL